MLSKALVIQDLMNKIHLLSPKSRLYLIQLTGDRLTKEPDANTVNRPLPFGEFAGDHLATWEDFQLAEWRTTAEYLNRF
jgi:hypothetical protein